MSYFILNNTFLSKQNFFGELKYYKKTNQTLITIACAPYL